MSGLRSDFVDVRAMQDQACTREIGFAQYPSANAYSKDHSNGGGMR